MRPREGSRWTLGVRRASELVRIGFARQVKGTRVRSRAVRPVKSPDQLSNPIAPAHLIGYGKRNLQVFVVIGL